MWPRDAILLLGNIYQALITTYRGVSEVLTGIALRDVPRDLYTLQRVSWAPAIRKMSKKVDHLVGTTLRRGCNSRSGGNPRTCDGPQLDLRPALRIMMRSMVRLTCLLYKDHRIRTIPRVSPRVLNATYGHHQVDEMRQAYTNTIS